MRDDRNYVRYRADRYYAKMQRIVAVLDCNLLALTDKEKMEAELRAVIALYRLWEGIARLDNL